MIPRFYCENCEKFKTRFQVRKREEHVWLWHWECRWCHKEVDETKDLLVDVIKREKKKQRKEKNKIKPSKYIDWIYVNGSEYGVYKCSKCGKYQTYKSNFCEDCGGEYIERNKDEK